MMKLAAIFTFFASAVLGAQSSSSVEANQVCVKACQVAPEDQRETCMRVCSQFAEQGINFAPATATTHSSAPAAKPTASIAASSPAKSGSSMAKPTDSPAATSSGASAMASGSVDSKGKPQGEDNAEDHSSNAALKSMSVAANTAHTAAARFGASALIIAAVALF
ncbi:hypothetical protein GGF38_002858 [Coemansia sp. RSA 25]|nr:hypothetical protein GGF38_002858 [Coemansia sp. RSA 25]